MTSLYINPNTYAIAARDFATAAGHNFISGGARNGWAAADFQSGDTCSVDASGQLTIDADGANGLQIRYIAKTFRLPGPPGSMNGIRWWANVDFTSTVATVTETEFRPKLGDSSGDRIDLEVHYAGAQQYRIQRDIGTDGGSTTSGATAKAWPGDNNSIVSMWWKPNAIYGGVGIGGEAETLQGWNALLRTWRGTDHTITVTLYFAPSNNTQRIKAVFKDMILDCT
jgi:hypothetical protein